MVRTKRLLGCIIPLYHGQIERTDLQEAWFARRRSDYGFVGRTRCGLSGWEPNPSHGLDLGFGLSERAEGLLTSLTFEEFLERAAALLWPRQRQALLLMLCNHVLVEGGRRPEQHPVIQALLGAFELDRAWLEQHLLSLRLLNDYAAFPQ